MAADELSPGDLAWVAFPEHDPAGHEQIGARPAIVVGVPSGPVRFPLLMVAPVTSRFGPWQAANTALYPALPAGAGGLPRPSAVLLDQLRAVDLGRVGEYIGALSHGEMAPIVAGLQQLLGLLRRQGKA